MRKGYFGVESELNWLTQIFYYNCDVDNKELTILHVPTFHVIRMNPEYLCEN
jgi:hypothetical protein